MPPQAPITSPTPAKPRTFWKKLAFVFGGIAVVSIVAAGTVLLLSRVVPQKQTTSQSNLSAQDEAKQRATQSLKNAQASEAKGDTSAAIAEYKAALLHYQDAGDTAGAESVKLQLQYLESLEKVNTEQ